MGQTLFAQTPIDNMRQQLEKGNVFSAWVNHETNDSFSGEKTFLTGDIFIGLQSYKIVSDARSFLVKDSLSIVYEVEENRVLISDYEAEDDDNSPTRFLYDIDDVYEQKWTEVDEEKILELSSTDPYEMYTSVKITFDKDSLPTTIIAIDQTGSTQTTRFEKPRFLESSNVDWKLEYPENAEIVDLR